MLKVQFPHRESEHEAEALRLWDGDGAIRLLDHDPERNALLLERARPGTPLAEEGLETALDVLGDLLPRLWKPAGAPFRPLAEEAAWWREHDLARTADAHLRDAAIRLLDELVPTQGEQVLLHQDLHSLNVLAAEREPWLVIDPKPLVGERELGVAALVRGTELGHSRREVLRRLDRLSSELGLDRERVRGWTVVQTLAWSGGSKPHAPHYEVARWLVEAP